MSVVDPPTLGEMRHAARSSAAKSNSNSDAAELMYDPLQPGLQQIALIGSSRRE